MKFVNAFIGIKRRMNDLLGWTTDSDGVVDDSIQDTVRSNMQRYGYGQSGFNPKGCIVGNSNGSVPYSYSDGSLTIKSRTVIITYSGRVILLGKDAIISGLQVGNIVYYKYEDMNDTDTLVDIQNSSRQPLIRDEKSWIAESVDDLLTTTLPTEGDYAELGKVVSEENTQTRSTETFFKPRYKSIGYDLVGTFDTPVYMNIMASVATSIVGDTAKVELKFNRVKVINGLIVQKSNSTVSTNVIISATSSGGDTISLTASQS